MIKMIEELPQIFDQRVKTKSRLIGDLWLRVRVRVSVAQQKLWRSNHYSHRKCIFVWLFRFSGRFLCLLLPVFLRRLRMCEKTVDYGNSSRHKKETNSTKKVVYFKKNWIFASGWFLSLKATKSFERTRLPDKQLSSLSEVGTWQALKQLKCEFCFVN